MFREIKKLTRSFKAWTWAIEDEKVQLFTDKEEVSNRWRQYCERLYHEPQEVKLPNDVEPDILKDEVRKAIGKLENNKAPGHNQI